MFGLAAPRQTCLLGLGTPELDHAFGGTRTDLGAGAWLELHPRWLQGHERLFEHLRDTTRWRSATRQMYERVVLVPRLTALLPDDGPGHPMIPAMATALSARYGLRLDRISMAFYRDGADSVAWHADKVEDPDRALIAIVSLGEPRTFLLKPLAGGRARSFRVGWGDLLVMGGTCQRHNAHSVPKASRAGPRIALMFRHGRDVRDDEDIRRWRVQRSGRGRY